MMSCLLSCCKSPKEFVDPKTGKSDPKRKNSTRIKPSNESIVELILIGLKYTSLYALTSDCIKEISRINSDNIEISVSERDILGDNIEGKYDNNDNNDAIGKGLSISLSDVAKVAHDKLGKMDELQKDCKSFIKLTFPKNGSKLTPKHKHYKFNFKIYAPKTFELIREKNGILSTYLNELFGDINDLDDLNIEMGLNNIQSFVTNSKSGQFFKITKNGKYFIKSMKKSEFHLVRKILFKYYTHMETYPDTLINKFYGMYRLRLISDTIKKETDIYFIVMGSVLFSPFEMNKIYDLKGSTFKRIATRYKVDGNLNLKTVYKQKNVTPEVFKLNTTNENIAEQGAKVKLISSDHIAGDTPTPTSNDSTNNNNNSNSNDDDDDDDAVDISESMQVILRSRILKDLDFVNDKGGLFIGQKRKELFVKQLKNDTEFLSSCNVMDYSYVLGMYNIKGNECNDMNELNDDDTFKEGNLYSYYKGGMLSKDKKIIYYGGIIDILQQYNMHKKAETVIKGANPKINVNEISSVTPTKYSSRMIKFISQKVK